MAEAKEQEVLGEAELLAPIDLGTRDKKRLEKLSVGTVVAYASNVEQRRCRLGLVLAVDRPAGEVQVRRYRPVAAGRLRVRWAAAFDKEDEADREAGQPSVEVVPVRRVLLTVQLHSGVLSHQAARKLDRAGWRLDERDLKPAADASVAGTAEKVEPGDGGRT
eukprot:2181557-Lingulodinium_polyedra.AAC.1